MAMSLRKVLLLAGVLLFLAGAVLAAAASGGFAIPWWTVDGGGGTSSGAAYTLSGTAGQADAQCSVGGGYVVSGGFLPPPACVLQVFLPLTVRPAS
jgi:hypothetical protein